MAAIDNIYRTLPAIIESLQREGGSAVKNIDSRFDPLYLQQMIIAARAQLIKTFYTGNRGVAKNHYIPDICKQTFKLEYDANLNSNVSDCWVYFKCPDFIALDDESNGLRFVGNQKGNNSFMILRSEEQFSQYENDNTMKHIMDNKYLAMYKADEGIIKLRDIAPDYKAIRHAQVRAVFSNPLDIPSYNQDTDPFPMSSNDINSLITGVWNQIRLESYGKPDEVADGSDTTTQANLNKAMFNAFIKAQNSSVTI